jgi:ribosomal protein S25
MKTRSKYESVWRCDGKGCDASYRSGSDPKWARIQVRGLGWTRRNKQDLCKACTKVDDARREAVKAERAKAKQDRRNAIGALRLELRDKVLMIIAERGRIDARALAAHQHVSVSTAKLVLRGMVDAGMLRRGGKLGFVPVAPPAASAA